MCIRDRLRAINDMEVLVKHFKAIGMQGLSEMMKNLSLPNFAHWRWGTLRDCCRELYTFGLIDYEI